MANLVELGAEPYVWSSGFAGSMFAAAYMGSGSALDDLPINGNEIDQALPSLPIIYETWNGIDFSYTETPITNNLNNLLTNGVCVALSNAGVQLYLDIDANANFITNSRTAPYPDGELAINTDTFPDGTNWIYWYQGSNILFSAQLYWFENAGSQSLMSAVGGVGTPGGNNVTPAITYDSVRRDVVSIYKFGLDGILFADASGQADIGAYYEFTRKLTSAILTPTVNNGPTGTFNRSFNNYNNPHKLLSVRAFEAQIDIAPASMFNQVNVLNYDVNTQSPGRVPNLSPLLDDMNLLRIQYTNELQHVRRGHYSNGIFKYGDELTIPYTQFNLDYCAMSMGPYILTCRTNQLPSAGIPIIISQITNADLLAIYRDTTSRPLRVFDNGISNSSCWMKPLANGDLAVWVVNESPSVTPVNVTISMAQLNLNTNASYYMTDIWNHTNAIVNGSVTIPMQPTNSLLERFSAYQLGSGGGGTNMSPVGATMNSGTATIMGTNSTGSVGVARYFLQMPNANETIQLATNNVPIGQPLSIEVQEGSAGTSLLTWGTNIIFGTDLPQSTCFISQGVYSVTKFSVKFSTLVTNRWIITGKIQGFVHD